MPDHTKYSSAQREAAASAVVHRGTSYPRTVELARAGALIGADGEPVPAFDPPVATVKTWASRARRRSAGKISTPLEDMNPRDAVENLRVRCVNAAAKLLESYERQLLGKGSANADPERLRQIIRVVREAAALPGPTDTRPPAPGGKRDGQRQGAETRGGLAGAILADVRKADSSPVQTEETAPGTDPAITHAGHSSTTGATHTLDATHSSSMDSEPGALVHGLADAVAVAAR